MDNTIKLNFLKFSEGSLENEKSKKNLLTDEDLSDKSEKSGKFILIGTEKEEKISIGEEENINSAFESANNDINNTKLDKNKKNTNKKSDHENELAITNISINKEDNKATKIINFKDKSYQSELADKKTIIKNKINQVETTIKKNNFDQNKKENESVNKGNNIINNNHIIKNDENNKVSFKNLFSNITETNKVRVRSIFKKYINYTNKKKFKENFKLEKLVVSNNLMADVTNNKVIKKLDSIPLMGSNTLTNIEEYAKADHLHKENNDIDINNISEKSDKPISNFLKNSGLNNFDRLKNILDIRSNDVNERLAHIFENNIINNKNKFEIQLRPERLGNIQVSLEISGENVDININSDNITTIQSLLESNNNLQKMLQSQGMNLNSFNLNSNNNKNKDKGHNSLSTNDEKNEVSKSNDIKEDSDVKVKSDKLVYIKA